MAFHATSAMAEPLRFGVSTPKASALLRHGAKVMSNTAWGSTHFRSLCNTNRETSMIGREEELSIKLIMKNKVVRNSHHSMNPIQSASFQLDLKDLKALSPTRESIQRVLLAACSAHNPGKTAQTRVLAFLLKLGANVDETDKNGVSALHSAVTHTGAPTTSGKGKEAEETIQILMEGGANPSVKNMILFG